MYAHSISSQFFKYDFSHDGVAELAKIDSEYFKKLLILPMQVMSKHAH